MPAKPNFFIVGAPKCGTTALYEYLRGHPQIFMPKYKEPHFFARDLGTYPLIKSPEAYAALFAEAEPRHTAVGEASVYYLRSTTALAGIKAYDPDARIIAMFRNPVEMVHSFHSQLLYVGEETVTDFEQAWRLQERRSQGLDLPPRTRGAFLLEYAELGRFGTQTERVLANFPASQVKLILFEDFAADAGRVYHDVIRFLGLPHDGRTEFARINENKRARLNWLKHFLRKPPHGLRRGVRRLKQLVGSERVGSLKSEIVRMNTVKERRPALSLALRAEMVETFRDEVRLLGELLGRDLSHWERT